MESFLASGGPVPALSAAALSKRYGDRAAVDALSFTVESGQLCALLGPNGAGKTTTMRMLVGLSRPDSGVATVLGEPVALGAGVLRRVGVVIDGPALVPHLTGRANLKLLWTATRKRGHLLRSRKRSTWPAWVAPWTAGSRATRWA